MPTWVDFLPSIIAGLISGSATALTILLSVVSNVKKNRQEANRKMDAIPMLEEQLASLRRQIGSWEEEPPTWSKRLLARSRTSTLTDLDAIRGAEDRIDRLFTEVKSRIRRLEERFEDLDQETRDSIVEIRDFLTREEYLRDQAERAEEVARFRESWAALNSMMRGVLATMGSEAPKAEPPRRLPPPPPKR